MRRYTSGTADSQPADADGPTESLHLPEESARQQRVQVCVCVCARKPGLCTRDCLFINSLKTLLSELSTNLCRRAMRT